MKKIILLLSFLFFSSEIFSQSLNFWPVIDVCTSTYQGNRPKIALLNETIPVVTFCRVNPDPAVFVSQWNGTDFGTPLRISPIGTMPLASIVNGPEITIQGNTIMIVYASHCMTDTTRNIYLVKSTDGGISWSDTINVVKYPDTINVEYPSLVILPNGNPVITFMHATDSYDTTQMMSCFSTDGGTTFSAPQNISSLNPGMVCECCPNSLVNNGDTVILAYRINDNNLRDFFGVVSFDEGQTFTNGFRIDNSNWINPVCPTNGIDLLAVPGKVLAAFPSLSGSYIQLKSGTLSFPSMTTGSNLSIDPAPLTYNQYYPALCGNADTICAVWHDNRSGNYDAIASVSVTGISGFAAPQIINDITTSTQKQADVAYGKGYFHFVFYDYTGKAKYRLGSLFPNGVEENKNENTISVSPNPSHEDFSITSSKEIISIKITDVTGKIILEKKCNSAKEKIPGEIFSPGIYFVIAEISDGSSGVLRFVKN